MTVKDIKINTPIEALNQAFLLNHPKDAARTIETMLPKDAAMLLKDQSAYILQLVWKNLSPGVADNVLLLLPRKTIISLLSSMDSGPCAALLSRIDPKKREKIFELLDEDIVNELKELLEYPSDSAGALMDTNVIAFNENMTVKEALKQLHNQKIKDINHLFLLNDEMYLNGQVPVQRLALADEEETLSSLSIPLHTYVSALDPKNEIMEKLEKFKIDAIPVIDGNDHFIGVVRGRNILGALKDTLATEMLTMVGVSKDERALSSSWFAVKKRLPWLQVNLLTAFLASAVVGIFESTIATYTALAILLPIAAGQSGNTGAQALAVTMRGLTLREITVRHWFLVLRKEAAAALINGIAVAITCSAGVYLWSSSSALALIIALAMISSMVIAAIAGALVPIILKKIGQDPALSSSIILTTITDIAGFMSFLGIATMLSGMLEAG
jgi:magnesium transporter